eukprot:1544994-Alexandrium_andersonii.AAC.1
MGHDGRTAFERLFGKPSRGDGYEFGEQAHYRVRPTDVGRSLKSRWGAGTWLGRRWGTASRVVAAHAHEV